MEDNIWYILKSLFIFVKILAEDYDVFHGDIKEYNIIITYSKANTLIIKLIDLGGV